LRPKYAPRVYGTYEKSQVKAVQGVFCKTVVWGVRSLGCAGEGRNDCYMDGCPTCCLGMGCGTWAL
jgi:hypothetical protein